MKHVTLLVRIGALARFSLYRWNQPTSRLVCGIAAARASIARPNRFSGPARSIAEARVVRGTRRASDFNRLPDVCIWSAAVGKIGFPSCLQSHAMSLPRLDPVTQPMT